ncbi:SEC-C metal-binding domain-containing protein [Methylocucumis oryzae]|uniref:Preprotein translocase subunit SecA n=1 Tax=Methylocucumis oryzae TaxID=1632867 RepID=A0A0F3IFY7_9GAMM|nr:SEC-C metal-binding domain-containing protein [Methylocucumis oryzae]KJV05468.1 hypothetical protein VZ94_17910 [Methylocucumis oryzae]
MIENTLFEALENCLNSIVSDSEKYLTRDELAGLLYAYTITPKAELPGIDNDASAWIAALFYGEHPLLTEEQIPALSLAYQALAEAYQGLLAQGQLEFPYNLSDINEENLDVLDNAYSWSQGFFTGLIVNERFWLGRAGEVLRPTDPLESVRNSAKLFVGLATMDFSDFDKAKIAQIRAFLIEQGQEPSNELIAATLFANVPTAVHTLQQYGLSQASARQPIKVSQDKVGRNEPCPCGSGKKYKKCCGA